MNKSAFKELIKQSFCSEENISLESLCQNAFNAQRELEKAIFVALVKSQIRGFLQDCVAAKEGSLEFDVNNFLLGYSSTKSDGVDKGKFFTSIYLNKVQVIENLLSGLNAKEDITNKYIDDFYNSGVENLFVISVSRHDTNNKVEDYQKLAIAFREGYFSQDKKIKYLGFDYILEQYTALKDRLEDIHNIFDNQDYHAALSDDDKKLSELVLSAYCEVGDAIDKIFEFRQQGGTKKLELPKIGKQLNIAIEKILKDAKLKDSLSNELAEKITILKGILENKIYKYQLLEGGYVSTLLPQAEHPVNKFVSDLNDVLGGKVISSGPKHILSVLGKMGLTPSDKNKHLNTLEEGDKNKLGRLGDITRATFQFTNSDELKRFMESFDHELKEKIYLKEKKKIADSFFISSKYMVMVDGYPAEIKIINKDYLEIKRKICDDMYHFTRVMRPNNSYIDNSSGNILPTQDNGFISEDGFTDLIFGTLRDKVKNFLTSWKGRQVEQGKIMGFEENAFLLSLSGNDNNNFINDLENFSQSAAGNKKYDKAKQLYYSFVRLQQVAFVNAMIKTEDADLIKEDLGLIIKKNHQISQYDKQLAWDSQTLQEVLRISIDRNCGEDKATSLKEVVGEVFASHENLTVSNNIPRPDILSGGGVGGVTNPQNLFK